MDVKRCFLLSLVLSLAAVGLAQPDPVSRIKQDLVGWREIMEMFIMDDGHYPEASSIEALAQDVYTRQYSEQIVVADPSGRPYRVSSTRNHYHISTADGSAFIENGFKVPVVKEASTPPTSPPSLSFPAPRSPDTTLYVTKSGNDIKLDWSGTGTQYDGAMGTDPRFSYSRTLFTDSTALTYTYTNGLLKYDETFLCFDVTDEVEQNHAGYWNGGVMPPPPPTIDTGSPSTNIGSLYVGSTGTIVGTGFSTNPIENYICFDGGVCTQATTATATQVQFTTPPGAVSGDLTVRVGSRSSDPAPAYVTMEDPATGWLIRTIGYSNLTGEYWMAGLSGINTIWRVYYDTGTKKWIKSDQKGGMAAQVIYCSGETSRTGRLFCGYGATGAAGGTRYVDTAAEPRGTLTTCIGLGGSGSNVNVRGAAADPNPDAVGGRDVAYFAFADTGASSYRIKKVAADCSSVLDADYGNQNWYGTWGSIVGMTVDQVTGDLYVASTTNVYKIDSSETITAVKGGFTTIYDLDLFRQSAGDPGFLLVADAGTAGAGSLKTFALDNTSASPLTVSSVSSMRAATWGGIPFNQATPSASNSIRRAVVHNSGNNDPVRDNPFMDIFPETSSTLWISAPSPCNGYNTGPPGQSFVTPSYPVIPFNSLGRIEMQYRDGKSRQTCAYTGDPFTMAPYEPQPLYPEYCDKPREDVAGACDNSDDLVAAGVGSFDDTGLLHSCKDCGSSANPCVWNYRITRRYARDNIHIFLKTGDEAAGTFYSDASPPFEAGKQIRVEPDKMCRNGGIIGIDAAVNDTHVYLSKSYNTSTLQWDRVDTVLDDNQISIFDSAHPFEGAHDTAYALITNPNFIDGQGRHYVEVSLKVAPGGAVYDLDYSYDASAMQDADPYSWTFDNGKSAGVCVMDNLFYQGDTSDLRQAYDEAGIGFYVPSDGMEGSGVVPYLPQVFFDSSFRNWTAFHQIWFSNKQPYTCTLDGVSCTGCCNSAQNIFHLVGSSRHATLGGVALSSSDFAFAFVQVLEDNVNIYCAGVPACMADKIPKYIRMVCAHEFGHLFRVNMCAQPSMHDDNFAWCGDIGGSCMSPCGGGLEEFCVMNGATTPFETVMCQVTDAVDRFDCSDLSANPRCVGVPDCSGPDHLSLRTDTDPE